MHLSWLFLTPSPSHTNLRKGGTSMAAWCGGQHVGTVEPRKSGNFTVRYNTKKSFRTFKTRVEATAFRDLMSDAAGKTRNQWRRVSGDRIEMKVPKGGSFFFDDVDLQWVLERLPWNMNNYGYVQRKVKGSGEFVKFAREKMGSPRGMVIDHIDGNPKNNISSNLRIVTHQQNLRNSKKATTNQSGTTNIREGKVMECTYYVDGIKTFARRVIGKARTRDQAHAELAALRIGKTTKSGDGVPPIIIQSYWHVAVCPTSADGIRKSFVYDESVPGDRERVLVLALAARDRARTRVGSTNGLRPSA